MIDWARVDELRGEIGGEDFAAIVDIFLEEVDAAVAELDRNRQTATLEAQLHFLKGSALNLGFARFSELCQAGESSAAKGAGDSVDLDAIRDSYRASRAQFLARLDAPTPC